MIAAIRDWIFRLICVSFLVGLVALLTPKGAVRRITLFCGGLLFLLALLQPALPKGTLQNAPDFARWETEIEGLTARYRAENQKEWEDLIADEIRTYIETEAKALGFSCTAGVLVETGGDGIPRVVGAEISAEGKNEALAQYMEQELGIPASAQSWKDTET